MLKFKFDTSNIIYIFDNIDIKNIDFIIGNTIIKY